MTEEKFNKQEWDAFVGAIKNSAFLSSANLTLAEAEYDKIAAMIDKLYGSHSPSFFMKSLWSGIIGEDDNNLEMCEKMLLAFGMDETMYHASKIPTDSLPEISMFIANFGSTQPELKPFFSLLSLSQAERVERFSTKFHDHAKDISTEIILSTPEFQSMLTGVMEDMSPINRVLEDKVVLDELLSDIPQVTPKLAESLIEKLSSHPEGAKMFTKILNKRSARKLYRLLL